MFYNKFKELCAKKGVSLQQAATDLGYSRSTVSKWKNIPESIPHVNKLKKIADYFGVNISDLMGTEKAPIVSDERVKRVYAAVKDLSQEQIADVLDYIEFVKAKRK